MMNIDCFSLRAVLVLIALMLACANANASTNDTCTSFAFPYTLAGADNSARIAELRQAIECSNANTSDNVIDLGGNTLVFNDGTYASSTDPHGNNALPVVTGNLSLQNGSLQRDTAAPTFRFIQSSAAATLLVSDMTMQHGATSDEGGAIYAAGALLVHHVSFEDNSADIAGGALSATAISGQSLPEAIVSSSFSGNTSMIGAAITLHNGGFIVDTRLQGNGDASSQSIISVDGQESFVMVNSLLAKHDLTASGSALVALGASVQQVGVVNDTIVDNTLQAALFAISQTATATVANSIFWGNNYASLGLSTVGYSIVQEAALVTPGSGNVNMAPGFVDAVQGDYHLASGSVAIDAGNDQYFMPDMLDADGDGVTNELMPDLDLNSRMVDDANVIDTGWTTNNLPVIDMGAYERQTDSDPPSVIVDPSSGLSTSEAGGTATFTVVLTAPPLSAVTLSLTSSNPAEGSVTPASLSFTASNWHTPQTVSVTGVDDAVADGDVAYTIVTSPLVSADARYANINPSDVSVTNVDDDIANWAVGGNVTGLLGSGLQVSLNGGAQSLTLAADGNFAFANPLPSGSSYAVSISAQPSNPAQTCVLANASGSVGHQDVANILINCGAANTYTVGGNLSGLASGASLTLEVNGGHAQTLSLDGAWVFPLHFAPGDGYVVSISAQPQGQHCSLVNASGSVGTSDVSNVNISCAAGGPHLNLSVDDGGEYAAYAKVRDYYVTLSNSGNGAANNVSVSANFDAAFDVPNVLWFCISGPADATCSAQGAGGFSDTASLPPGTSLVWVVSVPVRGDSQASAATFSVSVTGIADVSDTDTLVISRDGFDVPYGNGAQAVLDDAIKPAAVLDGNVGMLLPLPPPTTPGIHTLRVLRTHGLTVAVQCLALDGRSYVRLLARPVSGEERASAWTPAHIGAQLTLGSVAAKNNTRLILLEGATKPLQLLRPKP